MGIIYNIIFQQIEAAKKQLNHKSEGGLMASLAILQLCFEYMPEKTLEDNMHVSKSLTVITIHYLLCRSTVVKYFIPSHSSFAHQVMSLPQDGKCV